MTPVQETKKLARLSIRQITSMAAFSLGILALVVSVALVTITSTLERTVDTVVRDTRSQAIASQLELSLLTYQRLSNLFVLTEEKQVDDTRKGLVSEMRESLVLADDYAGDAQERELLDQVARHLSLYLQKREQVEARSLTLQEAVRATTPELNNAIEVMATLQAVNRSQVDRANAAAQRLNSVANMVGWTAAVTLVLGFLLIVLGVHRYVLRPILSLHGAMAHFRGGEIGAPNTTGSLREIAQLAQAFNEMADSLALQRQEQLTFLAGVAHDLRNPLNGIKLGLSALEQEQSTEKRARVCERLDRQVERLSRMVDDLLDATRIEAGALELREEEFDLRGVVEDMIGLYSPTSPDHQVTAEQPPEPVIIHGDPLRIEQVVSNLLSNAIKFSPEGGQITIRVGVENDEAILAVSDQGTGISPEEMSNLFLPFRRRQQDAIPGTGLGLSVVRRIVAAHGGSVDVDSEPGVETTFRVKLPLTDPSRTSAS